MNDIGHLGSDVVRPLKSSASRLTWRMLVPPALTVLIGLAVSGSTATGGVQLILVGLVVGWLVGAYAVWGLRREELRRVGASVVFRTWRGTRVLSTAERPATVVAAAVKFGRGGAAGGADVGGWSPHSAVCRL